MMIGGGAGGVSLSSWFRGSVWGVVRVVCTVPDGVRICLYLCRPEQTLSSPHLTQCLAQSKFLAYGGSSLHHPYDTTT